VNAPPREPRGVRAGRLGKRIYHDRMELDSEQDGRRSYRIYTGEPSFQREEGTDFAAIADGYIAVTPLHFDLTDQAGIEELAGFDLDGLLRPAAREV
jgi:5'-nucleotidase